jgi:long-subunit fatty acid transport protein
MAQRSIVLLVVAIGGWLVRPTPARAGGFEIPAAGTRPLGRGGAFFARADDTNALLYNPSALSRLPGLQLGLDLHTIFFDACFDRAGTYVENAGIDSGTRFGSTNDPPPEGYDGVEFPPVCNQGRPGIIPELALTARLSDKLGIGIGLLAPASVGNTQWGSDADGTIEVPTSVNEAGRLPSPGRYNLVEEELLLFWPSIGVGYAPHPMVQLGLTLGWGVGLFDLFSYSQPFASEAFSTDVRTRVVAKDIFVPRVTAAATVTPHERVDVMLGFTWMDDVSADGKLELTSGAFRDEPIQRRVAECSEVAYDVGQDCVEPIDDVRLDAPMPWQLAFGLRYGHPRGDAGFEPEALDALRSDVQDPMTSELFDIELDVVYERNSRVDAFVVHVPPDSNIVADTGLEATIPERNPLPHQWRDQVSLRLGSDVNVIPGILALRGGLSYENRGVDKAYAGLDFMPFARFGLHAGFTFRVRRFDVSFAYAHIFQETMTVRSAGAGCETAASLGSDRTCRGRFEDTDGDGEDEIVNQRGVPQVAATDAAGPPHIVNEGTYRSHFDVVSASIRYIF